MEDSTAMKKPAASDDEEPEEISESFLCCVCWELLHKPIVLSCGHISCFWCVNESMNVLRESHCPICRDPYLHFPSVCPMLHFLLRKMYPITYKKREEEILLEEQKKGFFSPQFDAPIDEPRASEQSDCQGNSADQKEEHLSYAEKLESSSPVKNDVPPISNDKKHEAAESSAVKEKKSSRNNGKGEQVSTADLLCVACEKLLFRPVVLNCGHVYCEACVIPRADKNEMIECQVCQVLDPRGFPRVCLVLDHFLKEMFPKEYASRTNGVEIRKGQTSTRGTSHVVGKRGLPLPSTEDHLPWWTNPQFFVHIGAGCDSCGMYPIIGERYRCQDCTEKIGYDLCKDCYNTRSKLPGRFNQQHTPEHRFRLADLPDIRLVTRQLEDGTRSFVIVAPESSDVGTPASNVSEEIPASDITDPGSGTNGSEDLNDLQSTLPNNTQSGHPNDIESS